MSHQRNDVRYEVTVLSRRRHEPRHYAKRCKQHRCVVGWLFGVKLLCRIKIVNYCWRFVLHMRDFQDSRHLFQRACERRPDYFGMRQASDLTCDEMTGFMQGSIQLL